MRSLSNFNLLGRKVKSKTVLSFFARLVIVKVVKSKRDKRAFDNIWRQSWKERGYEIEDFSIYDQSSLDLLAKFLGVFPVGTLRLIKSSSLPILNDFQINWNGDKVEATLLATRRFGLVTMLLLMRKAYQILKKEGYNGVLMIADKRVFRLLKIIGFPAQPIFAEVWYKGSVVVPSYLDFNKAAETLKKRDFSLYRFFTT